MAGIAANAVYGFFQLLLAETSGRNLDQMILGRIGLYDSTGINVFGSVGDADVYRTTGLTLDPSHLGVMLILPLLVLFPIYLRLERGHPLRTPLAVLLAFLLLVAALDALTERAARARRRGPRARVPLPAHAGQAAGACPARRARARPRGRDRAARRLLPDRDRGPHAARRELDPDAPRVLLAHPTCARAASVLRPRPEHVRLVLRVPDRRVELRAALVLRRAPDGDGARRDGALRRLARLPVRPPARAPPAGAGARPPRRRARREGPTARLGDDRGASRDARRERLLPDHAVLLLLRLRLPHPGRAGRLRPGGRPPRGAGEERDTVSP